MIITYLANSFRIFVCFLSDENIQAITLSSTLALSSLPLLQGTSGLARATHGTNLLPFCAGDMPSTAVTAATSEQVLELPDTTKISSQLHEKVQ